MGKSKNHIENNFFIGTFLGTADDKGRIMLPLALRKMMSAAANNCCMIVFNDDHFNIYPYDNWEKIQQSLIDTTDTGDPDQVEQLRIYLGGCSKVEIDGGGRLQFQKPFLEKLKIKKDVVLHGMFRSIEVWNQETFDKKVLVAASAEDKEKRKSAFAGKGIPF